MTAPLKKPATYDDVLALPPHLTGQIVDGELFTMPRPAIRHAHVASTLGMDVGNAFQRKRGGPGGWWILYEPELHLSHDIVVPDLAGWRIETLPQLPPQAFFTQAPDWVCEVLSPSTAMFDRLQKKRVYAREGVKWCWLIDPVLRTLEAFRLERGLWLEIGAWGNDDTPRVEPFEAIELALNELWLPPETPEEK